MVGVGVCGGGVVCVRGGVGWGRVGCGVWLCRCGWVVQEHKKN